MTGYSLNQRLLRPLSKVDFFRLAEMWQEVTITIEIIGMGGFASSPSLLNKLRGAMGAIFRESGSDPVQNRNPCNWSPACASEVFFGIRPRIAIGASASEITKPYILFAHQKGRNLLVGVSVFGTARDHIPEVRAALVQALRTRVRWRQLAKDRGLFVPASIEISNLSTVETNSITLPPTPRQIRLEFASPLDAERGQLAENPNLIFDRLARRLYMMARWLDAEISTDWTSLEQSWLNCTCWLPDQDVSSGKFPGGHKFKNKVVRNQVVSIQGDLAQLWPLLVIGERTNLGRGANIGLGKYTVFLED